MVLQLGGGGLFTQQDVRETPAGTSTSSSTIIAPIGTILPWLKTYTNTPQALPTGWVEADGATVSDAESVYNGQVLPDLNGGEFIRGAGTSGGTGGSDTMAHTHGVTSNVAIGNHTTLTLSNHSAIVIDNHTSLTMNNHTALTVNAHSNHTNIALSNHTSLTINNDTHDHNDTFGTGDSGTPGGRASGGINTAEVHSHSITGSVSNDTHGHTMNQNITAHSFSQNITAHSAHAFGQNISVHGFGQNISNHVISTNIDAHSFSQNISAHSVTNNGVTSDAASNTENRPKYYNVVWIIRIK